MDLILFLFTLLNEFWSKLFGWDLKIKFWTVLKCGPEDVTEGRGVRTAGNVTDTCAILWARARCCLVAKWSDCQLWGLWERICPCLIQSLTWNMWLQLVIYIRSEFVHVLAVTTSQDNVSQDDKWWITLVYWRGNAPEAVLACRLY